jgi:hypothetical protein
MSASQANHRPQPTMCFLHVCRIFSTPTHGLSHWHADGGANTANRTQLHRVDGNRDTFQNL